MVKKKNFDQENIKHTNDKEPTDNKENTNMPENPSEVNSISSDPKSVTSDDTDTDKVVAEKKVFEEKLAVMEDKYIRLSAEFDNYRKRTLKEKMELSKYASENILLKILPFMDDFERALKNMEVSADCTAIKDGLDLIYSKFSEFLKLNGVKEIESMNSAFDVDHHEAIAKLPVLEEEKKGKVVDVVLKGYYLNDKVLRFSKVVVGE